MKISNIINELVVKEIEISILFYQEIFDFSLDKSDGNPVNWVQLKNDNNILMLEEYGEVIKEYSDISSYKQCKNLIKFNIEEIDDFNELYNKCMSKNYIYKDMIETAYGKKEFSVNDPDENIIIVSYTKL